MQGARYFSTKQVAKSPSTEKTILQGWCDPKNCLWHVMIIDDGWTTKLTIHNVARPVIPLFTTPTEHLANNMPIMPSESNTTMATSLYKCSNTG
jgi:hypothetical protein